jgi:hypothetical protein
MCAMKQAEQMERYYYLLYDIELSIEFLFRRCSGIGCRPKQLASIFA